MELTWNDASLQRFTGKFVPTNTVIREKELRWLLGFICSCCSLCVSTSAQSAFSTGSRVVHMAAFPGSGKTMLLQQLSSLYSEQRMSRKHATVKKRASSKGESAQDSHRDSTSSSAVQVCPHSRVLMISCASKSWNALFQRITSELEDANLSKPQKRVRKSAKATGKESARDRLARAAQAFSGVLVLDEVDTVVSQRSTHKSPSHVCESVSGMSNTKDFKRLKLTRSTDEELHFLISAFESSPSGGLVLISNHLNIHAHKAMDQTNIHKFVLEAYSKSDLRAIIESRSAPEKIFEPPAMELLVSVSSDARRILNIASDAMLHARKLYRASVDSAVNMSYPPVTVRDIAHCCSGSGDVMLRQLRTILIPLSNDLQLLLTGIIHLANKSMSSSARKDSAVIVSALYRWVIHEGTKLTNMSEIYDDSSFRRGLQSLTDFNLIKLRFENTPAGSAQAHKASNKSLMQYKGAISLQYDAHALKLAIQGLIREGIAGKEAFHAVFHLL